MIVVGSALSIWKTLSLSMNSEAPIVVVLTGSMEPGYYRGDILLVTHWDEPLIPGDVVVYKLAGQEIPIVHRVSIVQEMRGGDAYILTKGDNNQVDDRALYQPGTMWLHKRDLMGKMRLYLPYMGMFTIWLNDYPMFKYAVLGLMTLFVLIAKDPQ
jgi:signal peptidase